jgi:GNAT superfamily N-acetyltransferase
MQIIALAEYPEAIPIIARWYYDEWGYADSENSYEKTVQRIKGKLNTDKLPMHLIAVDGGAVLGVVQLKYHEMSIYPDKEHWLGSVYTCANARGKGIASKLCGKAMAIARDLEIKTLYLQTEYTDCGGLYGRMGWKAIETVYYGGADVLVMRCDV